MSSPLVVFGAGGHGKVVCDILLANDEVVVGFLDDGRTPGERVLDRPVLGGAEWLTRSENRGARVALAVGKNDARERVAAACLEAGAALVTAIHPRAVVSPSATIAEGSVVMALAVINPDARIGRGAIINTAAVIEHDAVIGAFAHVSPNSTVCGNCTLGARAQLGVGASMLPGTTIDDDAVVGGGAFVARDIPARATAKGVPARVKP